MMRKVSNGVNCIADSIVFRLLASLIGPVIRKIEDLLMRMSSSAANGRFKDNRKYAALKKEIEVPEVEFSSTGKVKKHARK